MGQISDRGLATWQKSSSNSSSNNSNRHAGKAVPRAKGADREEGATVRRAVIVPVEIAGGRMDPVIVAIVANAASIAAAWKVRRRSSWIN